MKRSPPPTQKQSRNWARFVAMGTGRTDVLDELGTEMEASVKRGPQPENTAHKDVAAWRNRQPGLVLERNKRRLATPPGMSEPIMLGWLCDGSSDWLGYESMIVTNEMVGRRIAVAVFIETKRKHGGDLSDAQEQFLNNARDAGAIAGVARSVDDCELLRNRWRERFK